MILRQLKVGFMDNFTYIIGDEETGECAVIDPGAECARILTEIKKTRMKLRYIINTHSHPDHTACNSELVRATGAKIVMHRCAPEKHDISVSDGDQIRLGKLVLSIIHTPGHTPDGICVLVENRLFTGDTLFVGECGRTDLPGSSAEQLYHSFFQKLLKLDDMIEIYPGHDYGPKPSSTLGWERKHNYTLKPRSLEEFKRFMAAP